MMPWIGKNKLVARRERGFSWGKRRRQRALGWTLAACRGKDEMMSPGQLPASTYAPLGACFCIG